MASIEVKNFEAPDETRPFEGNGHLEIINVNGAQIGKAVFEPGWSWSQNVKPIAQTDLCAVNHFGYVLSGRMKIVMDDGSEGEIGPGDVFAIPAGHDAHVVGDEPCVTIDLGEEDADYAKRS